MANTAQNRTLQIKFTADPKVYHNAPSPTLRGMILRGVRLRAVSHCYTAPSREIEMSESPKLFNTARSRTPRSVILHQVKQFF